MKVNPQVRIWNESPGLAIDCQNRAWRQFSVDRDREYLPFTTRQFSAKLGVTSFLRNDVKTKAMQDAENLPGRQAPKFWGHGGTPGFRR